MIEDNRDCFTFLYFSLLIVASNTSQLNDSVYTSLLSYPAVTLPLKRSQSQPAIKTRPKKRPHSSIQLAGVILHSALLSGRHTAFNCDLFKSCDPFDNSITATQVKVYDYSLSIMSSVLYSIFMVQKIQSFHSQVEWSYMNIQVVLINHGGFLMVIIMILLLLMKKSIINEWMLLLHIVFNVFSSVSLSIYICLFLVFVRNHILFLTTCLLWLNLSHLL